MRENLYLLIVASVALIVASVAVVSVSATAKDIEIPSAWKNCRQDSDCSRIVTCGSCCPNDAINKAKLDEYVSLYQRECEHPRPPCPCAYWQPVCKQNICSSGR
jgi:hypothetical protein